MRGTKLFRHPYYLVNIFSQRWFSSCYLNRWGISIKISGNFNFLGYLFYAWFIDKTSLFLIEETIPASQVTSIGCNNVQQSGCIFMLITKPAIDKVSFVPYICIYFRDITISGFEFFYLVPIFFTSYSFDCSTFFK